VHGLFRSGTARRMGPGNLNHSNLSRAALTKPHPPSLNLSHNSTVAMAETMLKFTESGSKARLTTRPPRPRPS
jgi:hypothetical protein